MIFLSGIRSVVFLSTLSVRRATLVVLMLLVIPSISIHALREESDIEVYRSTNTNYQFLSTLSVRRATDYYVYICDPGSISIHALREESDDVELVILRYYINFYPRSP